jgi:predicted AAA+ superfamily ATPase
MELSTIEPAHVTQARLEMRLLYGTYPEVVLMNADADRQRYLRDLVASYLFKDILALEDVRHSDKLSRLLQLLAFQIGHDVSLAELGTQLGMSKNTVERYLDLLEKVFVIHGRSGFSRNLRKEVIKSRRYYFFDNGIRNALISNFNPLSLRDDVGALWENYVVAERLKRNLYREVSVQSYFWRTYDQKEIDLVEDSGGCLHAYEMKWTPSKILRPPRSWQEAYPEASFDVVHRDNYLNFVT